MCLSVSLATSKLTNCLVVSGEQQGKGLADGLCLLRASAFVSGQLSAVLASSHGTWQLSWIIYLHVPATLVKLINSTFKC